MPTTGIDQPNFRHISLAFSRGGDQSVRFNHPFGLPNEDRQVAAREWVISQVLKLQGSHFRMMQRSTTGNTDGSHTLVSSAHRPAVRGVFVGCGKQ